jgi:hypothetical protein
VPPVEGFAGKTARGSLGREYTRITQQSKPISAQNTVIAHIYIFFFSVVLAIYLFQGAITGSLRNGRGRSSTGRWQIPHWGRLLCFLLASALTAVAVFVMIGISK